MPVNPNDWSHHGGGNFVAVVQCPGIAGQRLLHLSQASGQASWVLRDFIGGEEVVCAPPPNRSSSTCPLADVDAEVTWSEFPPFYNKDNRDDWRLYLTLRTMAHLRIREVPLKPLLEPRFGTWLPM